MREIFRFVTILFLYIIAIVCFAIGIHQSNYISLIILSWFIAPIAAFALCLVAIRYLISLTSESTQESIKENGYLFFFLWALYYLLSPVLTPLLLLFMLIHVVIRLSAADKNAESDFPSSEINDKE